MLTIFNMTRFIPLSPSRVSELEVMARRSALLRASIELAERATNTTWQARFMANTESGADKLMRRACRQQLAAFRLQKWAGVLS